MKTPAKLVSVFVLAGLLGVLLLPGGREPARKVIVLGVDGLDPRLLEAFLEEGQLPNFQHLIAGGDFKPLETTMPPLSPVAWSTFITGMDPGGHAIFDFVHRNPESLLPEFAMVRTEPARWTLSVGSWMIPLRGGTIELLRKGRAFWEILEEHGVPTTVFRMPVNFPPSPKGRSLSGMGTPDVLGTPGTFSFYTDDPPEEAADISGGRIFPVQVANHRVEAELAGPENTFRRPAGGSGHPPMSVPFTVFLDPEEPVAKISLRGRDIVLREGEWSDWVRVDFEALPFVVSVSAVARFYLQEVRPRFRLYVTPLQINPEEPVMPLSNPSGWAGDLYRSLGYFYTQELPEDTKAFSAGIFSETDFWEQSQFVYREQLEALEHLLSEYREGLLFFYFSSVDQGSHMFWRYFDRNDPAYREHETLRDSIRVLYRQIDDALGRVLEAAGDDATVIVMSDHGFSPFYWGVNLNSWLVEKGYVRLLNPARRDGYPLFTNVDWSRTQAYAVGLNGLYVNLRGRERNGIVSQGAEHQRLLDRLEADLLAMQDPRRGRSPVTLVVQTRRDFKGTQLEGAPDVIVGYGWGYRSSWKSPLGEFPREIFVDNDDPWSGDHSVDYRLVPGVLVANRKITLESPALYDLTVAVLAQYGIAKLPEMIGEDCLGEAVPRRAAFSEAR